MESNLLESYTPVDCDPSLWSMSGLNCIQQERQEWMAGQYIQYYQDYVSDLDNTILGDFGHDSLYNQHCYRTDSPYGNMGFVGGPYGYQGQQQVEEMCVVPDNRKCVGDRKTGCSMSAGRVPEYHNGHGDQQLAMKEDCLFEGQDLEMYERTLKWNNNVISDQILDFAEKCKNMLEEKKSRESIQQTNSECRQYQVKNETPKHQKVSICEQPTSQEKAVIKNNTNIVAALKSESIQQNTQNPMPVIDFDISDFLDTGENDYESLLSVKTKDFHTSQFHSEKHNGNKHKTGNETVVCSEASRPVTMESDVWYGNVQSDQTVPQDRQLSLSGGQVYSLGGSNYPNSYCNTSWQNNMIVIEPRNNFS